MSEDLRLILAIWLIFDVLELSTQPV